VFLRSDSEGRKRELSGGYTVISVHRTIRWIKGRGQVPFYAEEATSSEWALRAFTRQKKTVNGLKKNANTSTSWGEPGPGHYMGATYRLPSRLLLCESGGIVFLGKRDRTAKRSLQMTIRNLWNNLGARPGILEGARFGRGRGLHKN